MNSGPSLASRIRGSLYGVAVVDALGAPVEFHQRGTFPQVTSLQPNPNFSLPPGAFTDDTSLTLCLAQSLFQKEGQFDIIDQAKKYVAWFKHGHLSSTGVAFDVGNATRVACNLWDEEIRKDEKDAEERGQRKIDAFLNKEVRCGNGSLMRTSPIALVFFRENDSVIDDYTAKAGSVTHPHALCVEACQVYVRLICAILRSHEKQPSKSALFDVLKEFAFKTSKIKDTFAQYKNMHDLVSAPESSISSSGFVLHTLEAALWVFFGTESFRDGAIRVVNLGDDADTVGAVYGGIAGAFYGIEEVPDTWLNRLKAKHLIDDVVEGVVALAEKSTK